LSGGRKEEGKRTEKISLVPKLREAHRTRGESNQLASLAD
jgi:hypothetical protein